MSEHRRLFVFGLGYSALRFAHAMKDEAEWIGGTTRSVEKATALSKEGLRPFLYDGVTSGIGVGEAARVATHIVSSIAPGEHDSVIACHADSIMAANDLRWLGYLSTVGVYGDYGGAWVGEATTPHPLQERAVRRVAAEKAWKKLAAEKGVPLAIFRIAGIYGPGRNAFVNLAEGKAHRIVKPGQVFNRIHVDDIAAIVKAAALQGASGIFNLADDEPAPPQDVVSYAAGLMGVPPPPEVPFEAADLTPMARSFYSDNKRVANDRLKADLGIALRYPTYHEGLKALWRDGWR